VDILVAAVIPGDDQGDDEVRGGEASKMVVAAAWIACRWVARAPPELADVAASVRAIRRPGVVNVRAAWGKRESGVGYL
jgi:hypothetical protein